jgi:integrase
MSRRTGQNGTVELRNGAWRGRYLVDVVGQAQRQRRSVVLGFQKEITKSEARRKLKEIIHAEGLNSPRYVIPAAESFSELVERWELTYLAKRKPSTQSTMHYHLDKYLVPKWGKIAVDHITAKVVDEWISELRHLAPSTIKGIVKTLQIALGRSLKGISYPSKVEVDEYPRCYTEEEVKRVVAAAEGQYKLLFLLAAETGARAGELFALTVEGILFDKRTIRINKSMFKKSRLRSLRTPCAG